MKIAVNERKGESLTKPIANKVHKKNFQRQVFLTDTTIYHKVNKRKEKNSPPKGFKVSFVLEIVLHREGLLHSRVSLLQVSVIVQCCECYFIFILILETKRIDKRESK